MALNLNHVHLKTPDPQKTAQFYIDTLGATKVEDVGDIGVRLNLHGLTLNVTSISRLRLETRNTVSSTSP